MARSKMTQPRDAVSATGTVTADGAAIKGHLWGKSLWVVRSASTDTVVKVQGCESESSTTTDWYDIATVTVTATGTYAAAVDGPHPYLRGKISGHTGTGTVTVKANGWEEQ